MENSMSDHAAAVAHEDGHNIAEHGHGHVGARDHHDDPESIAREKRKYLIIFGVLALLTVITVLANRLPVPKAGAIAIGLGIAAIKASLVAGYFMHLISERRLIYAVLTLTVFFFGMLLWGPWHHHYNTFGTEIHQPLAKDTTHSTTKTH
jgi:caa(3)-type oxidase subunit IV